MSVIQSFASITYNLQVLLSLVEDYTDRFKYDFSLCRHIIRVTE